MSPTIVANNSGESLVSSTVKITWDPINHCWIGPDGYIMRAPQLFHDDPDPGFLVPSKKSDLLPGKLEQANYMQVLPWNHGAIGLQTYRCHPNVPLPVFATEDSACFDMVFSSDGKQECKVWRADEPKSYTRNFDPIDGSLTIYPSERVMVPTNIIFNIQPGYYVELFSRSGISLKEGLHLVNGVGIIDADFKEEVHVLLTTDQAVNIKNNTRVCQGMLKQIVPPHSILEVGMKPQRTTSRTGGFGSTGDGKNPLDPEQLKKYLGLNKFPV